MALATVYKYEFSGEMNRYEIQNALTSLFVAPLWTFFKRKLNFVEKENNIFQNFLFLLEFEVNILTKMQFFDEQ